MPTQAPVTKAEWAARYRVVERARDKELAEVQDAVYEKYQHMFDFIEQQYAKVTQVRPNENWRGTRPDEKANEAPAPTKIEGGTPDDGNSNRAEP